MVVKYIKIIVATITLVVVGIITSINIYGEIYNDIDYRILETGDVIEINNNQFYNVIIYEGYSIDAFNSIFFYMDDYTIEKIEIQLPIPAPIYFYYNNQSTLKANNVYKIEFGIDGPELYIRFYDITQTLITQITLFEDYYWLVNKQTKLITNIQGYNSLGTGGGYTDNDLDNAWADGYDAGVFTVYENGFDGIRNPYTNDFYDNENSYPYYNGYDAGVFTVYENGFGGILNPYTNEYYNDKDNYLYWLGVEDSNDFSFTGLLFQVFAGIGSVLTIELLPNVTLGAIVAVPIVFGIIYFILGKKKGD